MKMEVVVRKMKTEPPSDLLGVVSIALFPFWRFDAKGGEVVLLGSHRDLHGSDTTMLVYHFFEACVYLSLLLNLFAFYLCETMFMLLYAWCETYGFLIMYG